VARLELGAQQYDQSCAYDGKPANGIVIFHGPGR